ncbi:MAG TPA: HAD family hydrolase [Phycisphaerales bacterium]|nr:HAD family hydrolase [Phycisphaerales bacterium]
MQPAVFLDRDNTLIANDGDLGDPLAVKLIDGVAPGLAALRDAGYRLVVVTNQAGVARGKFTESDVDLVHQKIAAMVDETAGRTNIIDRFYYCPYHPEGTVDEYRRDHPWRKPHPGMLLQAARDLNIDLSHSWMVGDQARDMLAGRASGCRTILISSNGHPPELQPSAAVPGFSDAVQHILKHPPANTNGTAPARSRMENPPVAQFQLASDHSAEALGAAVRDLGALRRSILDLADELRSHRQRGSEFTILRMVAVFGELLVVLLAALGLMQLNTMDVFLKWMIGALLVQLITIALLLLDNR